MAQLLRFINDLPLGKKITLVAVLLATVGGIAFAVHQARQASFQVLYSRLAPEDSGAIIAYLKEHKIPYKVDPLSGAIMVPMDRVYELRLELAAKGLPQGGGAGFEVFDKSKFGMSDFMQKVNYQRALQGELARTICKLDAVQECRVHLVLPEDSPFVEESRKARASVVVKLKPGQRLGREEVEAIVHLVSSAVKGLEPDGVTVIDTKGRLLSAKGHDPGVKLSAEQVEFQRQWERSLEDKIVALLEPVVGRGKVVAKVSSEMEWRRVEQTQESYDPNAVIRSRQVTEEGSGSTPTNQGVPGVASNVPGGRVPQKKVIGTTPALQRRSETVNYEVGRIVTHTLEPVGRIKRLQVAVLVDGTYREVAEGEGKEGAGEKGGAPKRVYVPRTPEEMAKIEEMVKRAVGFNPQRGDEVTVVNLPFETSEPTGVGTTATSKPGLLDMAFPFLRHLTPAVVVILLFLFVVRPMIKGLTARTEVEAPEAHEAKALESESPRPPLPSPKELALQVAREDTDFTVEMIRRWLRERKGGGG
ncbi:MAG TPA: flagellar M-ring protein FliF [Deltaproteobacteria bacterium]|nr:flagellar M-ring protein FliF [Deltaproteobacteria bacterium]